MTTAGEFLGYRPAEDGSASFELGPDVHGAFGGVFGGAVAAACVMAARPAARGRRPFSAHVTFVRGLSTPTCTATTEVVASGRTVTTVGVDLADGDGRLASRAMVTFAADDALHRRSDPGRVPAPTFEPHRSGREIRMGEGIDPPIVKVMDPRLVGEPSGGYAHSVRLPWDDPGAGAEAACMAADFCVGVPVGAALHGEWVPIPNPDLSLRFLGAVAGPSLVAVGRLGGIDAGVAGTQVEVWDGERLFALGLSSTVLLGGAK